MGPLRPDQTAFRALYKELVETNTTLSAGSCTLAAEHIAAHLKAAGFAEKDITLFSVPEHPKEGGVVAVLRGNPTSAKPMLLLGHLDVVEAKREDWMRDPFTLIEENGYFFGRGTSDMKAMDATWIDALMRFKQSGYRPKRTIKMALTCGEETTYAFNGADWLAKNKPRADFRRVRPERGRRRAHRRTWQVWCWSPCRWVKRHAQNYRLETTNAGGHSSIPIRDNAIYELADALAKVRDYEFPVKLTDTTRAFFAKAGAARGDDLGRAMVALSNNPNDSAAEAIVSKDRSYHSMLRTTCVATLLDGGHAKNALPQRATANVNCRIFPGETVEGTQAALVAAIARSRRQSNAGAARSARSPCRPRWTPRSWVPPRNWWPNTFPAYRSFPPCPRARLTVFSSRPSVFPFTVCRAVGEIPMATVYTASTSGAASVQCLWEETSSQT